MTPEILADILKRSTPQEDPALSAGNAMRMDAARAIPILRNALAAWNKSCPYKIGDILRVARHATIWRATLGHVIVLKVHEQRQEAFSDAIEHMVVSTDMRVLTIHDNGSTLEFDVHSRDFDLVESAP